MRRLEVVRVLTGPSPAFGADTAAVSAAQARWATAVAGDRESVLELALRLRDDLGNGRLVPMIEPVFHLPSGILLAGLALGRWESPQLQISAQQLRIIATAADAERMLDQALLDATLAAMVDWRPAFAATVDPVVGVDQSLATVRSPTFAPDLLATLGERGIAPGSLQIVVPTAAAVDPDDTLHATVEGLRNGGVKVGMQGVGSAASSFAAVRTMRCDGFRLAAHLVAGLARDASARAVVRGLGHLAVSLGMVMVASGVASETQYDALLAAKRGDMVLMAKGPWLGEPMTVDEFAAASVASLSALSG